MAEPAIQRVFAAAHALVRMLVYPVIARESLFVEGLQQVIDGFSVKCLNCVLVIRRGEDDFGPQLRLDPIDDGETVFIRHLYVEEHQRGSRLPHRTNSVCGGRALANDPKVGVAFQEDTEFLPGENLVIHNERVNGMYSHNPNSPDKHR
jgi:hypothetical protein